MLACVEEHLDHKKDLFSRVWENEDLPLRMWRKDPTGYDKFFRNELIISAGDQEVGEVLLKRRWWTPLLKLLRRIRILIGII